MFNLKCEIRVGLAINRGCNDIKRRKQAENSTELVCRIAKKKLGIDLRQSEIDCSYRVGEWNNGKEQYPKRKGSLNQREKEKKEKHRPIIVKFVSL